MEDLPWFPPGTEVTSRELEPQSFCYPIFQQDFQWVYTCSLALSMTEGK